MFKKKDEREKPNINRTRLYFSSDNRKYNKNNYTIVPAPLGIEPNIEYMNMHQHTIMIRLQIFNPFITSAMHPQYLSLVVNGRSDDGCSCLRHSHIL